MLANQVHDDMLEAMKAHDSKRKTTLSLLYNSLNLAAKEKHDALTTDEENQIVFKMMKQIKETIDSCPPDRNDIREAAELELETISVYAPKQMDESEINSVIDGVFTELGITNPTSKDKGIIMKSLMPKVKGKADGKLVNQILTQRFF